jgi:hypothetical protein
MAPRAADFRFRGGASVVFSTLSGLSEILQQRGTAVDIQVGFLLAGVTDVRQILDRGGRVHGDIRRQTDRSL